VAGKGKLLIVSAFETEDVDTPAALIENLSKFQRQKVSDPS
jgi:hypothetical protein